MATELKRRVHANPPQLRSAIIEAQTEVFLASRRVGKTTGPFASRISNNAFHLPRSLGGIVAPSYKKFLTFFIPSLINGLETLGYREDRDYVIGRRGPKEWELPHHRPTDWKHMMHWRCGSANAFISQDGQGAGAGLTLDHQVLDEAKYLDGERWEAETLPAMSGHPEYFGGRSEHLSLLISSDMPATTKGRWFFKYKEMMDMRMIDAISDVQIEIQHWNRRIDSGELSPASVFTYQSRINSLKAVLNQLRIGTVHWHEASTVENIHALGIPYFKSLMSMHLNKFNLFILNIDAPFVETGFYPDLNDDVHTYTPQVASYTLSLGLERSERENIVWDSRHDAEIHPNMPLEIAMDYGGSFNCMAIGQPFADVFRIDNGLHVYYPSQTKDVVLKFCEYYKHHKRKEVLYYYDHTAIGKDGKSPYSYHEIVIATLESQGWIVRAIYIGQQPGQNERYVAWGDFLGENKTPPFRVEWNRENCEDMLIALHMTGARQELREFKKEKEGPEKDKKLDQAHAPHYGDACDTLVMGRAMCLQGEINVPAVSGFA